MLKFCESGKSTVCFFNLPTRMSGKNLGFCQKDKGSVTGSTTKKCVTQRENYLLTLVFKYSQI